MKRKILKGAVIAGAVSVLGTALLFLWAGRAAAGRLMGELCRVEQDEVIAGDLYALCNRLEIEGEVEGDVVGVGITTRIKGTIGGDLFLAGLSMEFEGSIGEDLRYLGLDLDMLQGTTFASDSNDIAIVALNTEMMRGVELPGSALIFGFQAFFNGAVGKDIDFYGSGLEINGEVGGSVSAAVSSIEANGGPIPELYLPIGTITLRQPGLRVGEDAHIQGTLEYRGPDKMDIPPDAVEGEIVYEKSTPADETAALITPSEQQADTVSPLDRALNNALRDALAILVVGLPLLLVVPQGILYTARTIRYQPVQSFLSGALLTVLFFPLAVMLAAFSVVLFVGVWLATLGAMMPVTGIGLFIMNAGLWVGFSFAISFLSRAVFSYGIGRLLLGRVDWNEAGRREWIFAFFLGTIVYCLITNLLNIQGIEPLGQIVNLAAAATGLGGMALLLRELLENPEEVEESEAPPGMENLPPGFTGFDW